MFAVPSCRPISITRCRFFTSVSIGASIGLLPIGLPSALTVTPCSSHSARTRATCSSDRFSTFTPHAARSSRQGIFSWFSTCSCVSRSSAISSPKAPIIKDAVVISIYLSQFCRAILPDPLSRTTHAAR